MKLQKLGIEIRKIGDIKGLYAEVDLTLGKMGIRPLSIGIDMQKYTVAHSLQHMIGHSTHFSICTITSCAKLCGIIIPRERDLLYSAAHCMDWNEMIPEYRQGLVAMILDDFRCVLNPSEQN